MEKIVIFGAGGHAKVVYDIIVSQQLYNPVAFVSADEHAKSFLGLPHFHQSQFSELKCNAGIVAIGDNSTRSRITKFILDISPEFLFVTAIHPSAQIASTVKIGCGTVVMANVAINSETCVQSHVIVNTGSNIDHDCHLEDFSSIAPGCTLGGGVSVGAFSAISLGANVIHGKKIGMQTVIGAGSVVIKDIPAYHVAYGNPCRVVRMRQAGEKYL